MNSLEKVNPKTWYSKGAQLWMQRFHEAIDEKLHDSAISNTWLAHKMEISQRQLIRKVKEFSGLPPRKYLRQYRLNKAMNTLKAGTFLTVKETAYAVGFEKVSYFTNQFEAFFGKKPLEILREHGWR